MKPNVVILSAFLTPFRSGAEACAEEVPLRLADRYDFTIVTARLSRKLPREALLRGKIPVLRVGFGFPFDKWLYPFLAPLVVRKLKPDIVHAILETFAGLALHFCRWTFPKAKRLLTLQTTNRSFLKGPIVRSADRVTAISSALASIAHGLGRRDVTVIPNGIDYEAFRAACGRYPKVSGRVVFVGRLEPMKGVDLLLRAFALVQAEGVTLSSVEGSTRSAPSVSRFDGAQRDTEGACLHVVGDGSQRPALEKLSRDLGIDPRVRFHGRLEGTDLHREYAEAEVFCGPSRSEALGNVFLEAQAAGCAVIAAEVGGVPEIIEDGESGMLVPPENSEALGTAIIRMFKDSALRNRCARGGIERSKAYNWQGIAQRYHDVYQGN